VDPHLTRLRREIETAVAGSPAEQLSWHPAGKWSAAEVLEHLYLTYTGTAKGFERVSAAGKSLATPSSWRLRVRGLVVLGFGYIPSGRQAPPSTLPRGLAPDKILAEIGTRIVEMDEIIGRCEEKLGKRKRLLDHPVLGPLTGAQWRRFHLVHGLHHLKQVRRLRDSART
jgi:hypothetical protein